MESSLKQITIQLSQNFGIKKNISTFFFFFCMRTTNILNFWEAETEVDGGKITKHISKISFLHRTENKSPRRILALVSKLPYNEKACLNHRRELHKFLTTVKF